MSRAAIDRLGQRLRAHVTPDDARAYDEYRAGFAPALLQVEGICRGAIIEPQGTTARLKTLESTVAKLRRGSFRLSQINDIAGVRFVLDGLRSQARAFEGVVSAYPGARVNDYRERPHYDYRALHVVVRSVTGRFVEVQLRTEAQNDWANVSEAVAGRLGLEVKYGGGPPWVQEGLGLLSQRCRSLDLVLTSAADIDDDVGAALAAFEEARRRRRNPAELAVLLAQAESRASEARALIDSAKVMLAEMTQLAEQMDRKMTGEA